MKRKKAQAVHSHGKKKRHRSTAPEPAVSDDPELPSSSAAQPLAPDSNWNRLRARLPPPKPKPASHATPPKPAPPPPPVSSMAKSNLVALDCEMVGVGSDKRSALARVCIIDGTDGSVLLDSHVRPHVEITDFRTRWSGILPHHVRDAPSLRVVQASVREIIHGKIVIGHGLHNDFGVLGIDMPPKHYIRDTSLYKPFRLALPGGKSKPRKLKDLALEQLGQVIQEGRRGHDPAEDAKAALNLYFKVREAWDAQMARHPRKKSD